MPSKTDSKLSPTNSIHDPLLSLAFLCLNAGGIQKVKCCGMGTEGVEFMTFTEMGRGLLLLWWGSFGVLLVKGRPGFDSIHITLAWFSWGI